MGFILAAGVPDASARWLPKPTTAAWQWQLTTPVDTSVPAPVYEIDGWENDASVVADLHAKGRKVICYMVAGSYEPFRPDAGSFPPEVLGRPLDGFEDERWLDIRRIDLLRPIIEARFRQCKEKGFDAIEADNVDGFENRTGFPLTPADQLRYNRFLADLAHGMDISIALKNDTAQVRKLVRKFDMAVVEQCFEFDECEAYSPFIRAKKAVFIAEYRRRPKRFCADARDLRMSAIFKRLDLDAFRLTCPRR
ncbi:MAG: endo alpha-1,4 polygalactosaminidase [Thermoleophilaceae bacterium]|nr:endo alpha-1,4 polygalactosaminidase [Thermoleophilaceae bacterium]